MDKYKLFFLTVTLVLFSLFDNYLTFRILDVIGLSFFLVYCIMNSKNLIINKNTLFIVSIFSICLFLPATFLGILSYQSYAGTLFLIGLFVLLLSSSIKISNMELIYMLKVVILLLSFGLFLQVLLHILTGNVQNLLLVDQGELRANFADKLFRYTGFYIEPGSHALAIVLLNALYITVNKRRDFIAHISIASVFVTMSLAGMLASVMLYLIPIQKTKLMSLNTFKKLFYAIIILLLLFSLLYQIESVKITLFDRIFTALYAHDGSANDRIIKFFTPDCQCFLLDHAFLYILFSGITSDYFAEMCSSNNIAFFIFSFGYLGGISIWITLLYYVRKKFLILFALIYIMFSGTLSSYMFIWFYLGLVVNYINLNGYNYDE